LKKSSASFTRTFTQIKLFRYIAQGYSDLREGLGKWRLYHLIGSGDLRRRYARSRIGRLWVTLSTGLSIFIMAFIWSTLFKMTLSEMLPFMAVSLILWQFFSGIMSDSVRIFTSSSHLLLNQRMVCSTLVLASIYRNIITFLYNLIIIPIVFVAYSVPIGLELLLIFPGLMLVTITSVWVSYVLGALCARFRDLPNIINSVMQLAFYITPVLWKPDFIGEDRKWVMQYNPFTYFLNIMRSPIMREPFSMFDWSIAALITFTGLLFSLIFIGKYRRQILYWI
jgi:ABC-type polysaccharide/polyol phosphate export permease